MKPVAKINLTDCYTENRAQKLAEPNTGAYTEAHRENTIKKARLSTG